VVGLCAQEEMKSETTKPESQIQDQIRSQILPEPRISHIRFSIYPAVSHAIISNITRLLSPEQPPATFILIFRLHTPTTPLVRYRTVPSRSIVHQDDPAITDSAFRRVQKNTLGLLNQPNTYIKHPNADHSHSSYISVRNRYVPPTYHNLHFQFHLHPHLRTPGQAGTRIPCLAFPRRYK
jgi:hypothetical protein